MPDHHGGGRHHGQRVERESDRVSARAGATRKGQHGDQPQRSDQQLRCVTQAVPHRGAAEDFEIRPRTVTQRLNQQRRRNQSPRETGATIDRAACRFIGKPRRHETGRDQHHVQQDVRSVEQQHRRIAEREENRATHGVPRSRFERVQTLRREKDRCGELNRCHVVPVQT